MILQKVAVPAGFAKFAIVAQNEGESIRLDFDRAFVVGTEDLMKQPNVSMDNVRALKAKIEAASMGALWAGQRYHEEQCPSQTW